MAASSANSGFNLTDANNGEVPGYAVVDATAAYVQRKYEVRLNVFNVFDKIYYLGGYKNSPNRVLPGMPRAAQRHACATTSSDMLLRVPSVLTADELAHFRARHGAARAGSTAT